MTDVWVPSFILNPPPQPPISAHPLIARPRLQEREQQNHILFDIPTDSYIMMTRLLSSEQWRPRISSPEPIKFEVLEAHWGIPPGHIHGGSSLEDAEMKFRKHSEHWVDVTSICQNLVKNNSLSTRATTVVFGGPHKTYGLILEVVYRLGDKQFTRQFYEPGMVELP